MAGLQLTIISPQKKVLETGCEAVSLPTVDGEITVLPGHMAVFTLLQAGEVRVRSGNGSRSLAVGGGYADIDGQHVTLLVEFGISSDEIDEEQVREAKRRAEEILKNQADERGSALAQATLARSLLELKMVQKRRRAV